MWKSSCPAASASCARRSPPTSGSRFRSHDLMSRRPSQSEPAEASAPAYAVPALEKGLDVLELLAKAHQPLGLNEVAAALGRSRQELFRIMVCLHTRGYLLRDASGR